MTWFRTISRTYARWADRFELFLLKLREGWR
ncbi:hypothetical protein RSK20926_11674 [Roseobacter sp. SK209-2-6]|nr:hypothetical protein RSK20926_11674 [Roseobacter sp. SK209-2-6]